MKLDSTHRARGPIAQTWDGGKAVAIGIELNGLSLGGVGRGTTIDHVDIMNNLDDGIEIWGGTVGLKYLNIWNIGDDAFDVDQGWRGKAQFGLIVQGYSRVGAQGSGVGDNSFEMDGAEQSDFQPVTTASLYNFTVIGQPVEGDQATAWRDNARVQFHNCIFMDTGEQVVKLDNVDGDGGAGYGFNGTLSWVNTWTTPFNAVPPHANDAAPGLLGWAGYPAQSSGTLISVTDSVFFRNPFATAYTEAVARGVFAAANHNVQVASILPADAPISSLTRTGPVLGVGGGGMVPVIGLDPRPQNDAITSFGVAPNDGFFTPAHYRGAFAPGLESWLCSWTASNAFGYSNTCGTTPSTSYCAGNGTDTACPCGNPGLAGRGCENTFATGGASLTNSGTPSVSADTLVLNSAFAVPFGPGLYYEGSTTANAVTPFGAAFGNGLRCAGGATNRLEIRFADSTGAANTTVSLQAFGAATANSTYYYQLWYRDTGNVGTCTPGAGFNFSNAVAVTWVP